MGEGGPDVSRPEQAVRRVRVAIVDDIPDMRRLLRFAFEDDSRFEIVGEAADGVEAIALADTCRPDLMILDCNMPVMSGVEALPEIRRRSPSTIVVVYTADATAGTYQAALAAGALDVMEKTAISEALAEEISRVLVDHWARPDADVEVRVGPVSSAAARSWVDNTTKIMVALRARPDVLGQAVPDDVLDLFEHFLDSWRGVTTTTEDFYWVARGNVADVERIVHHWVLIDAMTDEQLTALGVHWSTPDGRPFFEALTAGVLDALAKREDTQALAKILAGQWGSPPG